MKPEEAQPHVDFVDKVTDIEYDAVEKEGVLYLALTAIFEDERQQYNPYAFVFFKIATFTQKLDVLTDLAERTRTAINAKMRIIHLIENIKQQERHFKTKPLDFSGDLKRLDGIIENAKIDLDLDARLLNNKFIENQSALIEKQQELITNQINTNIISKITNRYIAIFTAFAGGWYLYDLLYRIASEETIVRHLDKISPHYKNLKFGICFLITAVTILCIYALLEQGQKRRNQIAEADSKKTP